MMTAYKLQNPGLDEAWKTFLFDKDHQLFVPVWPFLEEYDAANRAEFKEVQLAWYLDQLYAPAEFVADEVPHLAAKILLLIAVIKKEFAADSLRQPHPKIEEALVIRTRPDLKSQPAPDALN